MPNDTALTLNLPRDPYASRRIRGLALAGELACWVALAVVVGTWLLALLHAEWRDHIMFGGLTIDGQPPLILNEATKLKIALLMLFPVVMQSTAIWFGLLLFKGYRRGEIFTPKAANRLSRVGWAILALMPFGIVLKLALGRLLASSQSGVGAPLSSNVILAPSISDIDVSAVAFGLLAILIGRVLGEAAKLSDEHRQFV
jgi:hypothetical protein